MSILKPFIIRDCYSAQIEVWALLCLRIGYTAFGLALWPTKMNRRPWWIPHVHLSIWSHTGDCDQRWVFRLKFGRRMFGYLTRGDATPNSDAITNAGWWIKWRHLGPGLRGGKVRP